MASARRRKLGKFLVPTAAVVAAVALYVAFTLPPRPRTLATTAPQDLVRRTVAGAYHVHSTLSDGAADVATIAAAAKRAGLQFVILTDHGDGTRTPEAPRYIDGVLCLDAVEISTDAGHYVALGLPATPYPLGGDARGVVEDVRRFGGFGIVAHPDSPKPQLAWSEPDWDAASGGGMEWLNVDSVWRRASRLRLVRAFVDYWFRPAAAMTSLLSRPEAALAGWEAHAATGPVVALAAHDAHGGIGRTDEDGRRSAIGGVPSYEATFRAFADRAILAVPWTGDPGADGAALLQSIRHGHVYTVIDGIAGPVYMDFRARGDNGEALMGDMARPERTTLRVTGLPDDADVAFVKSGAERLAARQVVRGTRAGSGVFELALPEAAGVWHVEVQLPGAPGKPPVPWIVTNPIYFIEPPTLAPDRPLAPGSALPAATAWHVEKDPASEASVSLDGSRARFTYRLAAGERRSQFVALAVDLPPQPGGFDRMTFSARSSQALRLSVQLRVPDGGGLRWGRSVYVEPSDRRVPLRLGDLRPLDRQTLALGDGSRVRTLLFVVDLTNARPGDRGAFEISDVSFGR